MIRWVLVTLVFCHLWWHADSEVAFIGAIDIRCGGDMSGPIDAMTERSWDPIDLSAACLQKCNDDSDCAIWTVSMDGFCYRLKSPGNYCSGVAETETAKDWISGYRDSGVPSFVQSPSWCRDEIMTVETQGPSDACERACSLIEKLPHQLSNIDINRCQRYEVDSDNVCRLFKCPATPPASTAITSSPDDDESCYV